MWVLLIIIYHGKCICFPKAFQEVKPLNNGWFLMVIANGVNNIRIYICKNTWNIFLHLGVCNI